MTIDEPIEQSTYVALEDPDRPDPGRGPGGDLGQRWRNLTSRQRSVFIGVGLVVAYLFVYNFPATESWIQEHVPYGVLFVGTVQGATTALMAMGLILIYRTNRFVNFAYGAMGALPGTFALGLHLEKGLNFFAAVALAVVFGIAVGFLTELVIRRFKASTRLIVTVASIGLAQILGVLSVGINILIDFLSLQGGFATPIDVTWNILDNSRPVIGDEILIIAVVPVVIMGLAWFLLRTDAGVALRAAAENEDRALLLGIPVYKLGRIVWMIAGGLAALTFVLQAPSAGIAPATVSAGPTILLPALAAAVVARLESLPMAFFTGIGLGMLDQTVRWNWNKPSLTSMAFLVVIIVALLLQRKSLSRAMNSESAAFTSEGIVKPIPRELRWLPEIRITKVVLWCVVIAAFVYIPSNWQTQDQLLASFAMVWAMVGVSLVLLTGWGGHISLGQFAVAGLGGLIAGNLLVRADVDFFLILIAAGLAGALAALVIGLPALRIRGLFLAVTTLAFAVAMNSYVLNTDNFPTLIPSDVPKPYVWERWSLEAGYPLYLVSFVLLVLSFLAAKRLRNTRSGRVIIATRDNERAADSASVSTTRVKLSAFLLSGFIAGVAGAVNVVAVGGIGQGQYSPELSLDVFATAVIGGLGSLAGAVSGVLLFQFIGTVNNFSILGLELNMQQVRPLISGAGLLIVLLIFPGGFAQLAANIRDRFLRVIANRRGIIVPSLVADKRSDDDDNNDDEGLLAGALGAATEDPAESNGHRQSDDADLVGAQR